MEPQEHIIISPDSSAELNNLIQYAELTECTPQVLVQTSQSSNCLTRVDETDLVQLVRQDVQNNPGESIELMSIEEQENEEADEEEEEEKEVVVEHVLKEEVWSSQVEGGGGGGGGGDGSRVDFEIPSSSVYLYENPLYLNRLMKDNKCGRSVRPDAPYTHRLGPWDDVSTCMLIELLKQYPDTYFILNTCEKRTEAWEVIRQKLDEMGYKFTVLQIRMHWREVIKRYHSVLNHNDLHKDQRSCQYFSELNSLFGIWDSAGTLLLIQYVEEVTSLRRLGQNGGTRMKYKTWKKVQEALGNDGYMYTTHQVQGRWSILVTLYRRMVQHNTRPVNKNQSLTMAYQEAMEAIFNRVPVNNVATKTDKKITEESQEENGLQRQDIDIEKSVEVPAQKWTTHLEKILLQGYRKKIDAFMKAENKREVWEQLVKMLSEEGGYKTTVDKARGRFYDLVRRYKDTLIHNIQQGALYRECRHHHLLAEIYSVYNCWPHDKSLLNVDDTEQLRTRLLMGMLEWSNEECRALLTVYPGVLHHHLSFADQPPQEELWVQLAKDLTSIYNFYKEPFQIGEHLSHIREGYHGPNPFPFVTEMKLVESTEETLGYTPEPHPLVGIVKVQYWSTAATTFLLSLMTHYCQENFSINSPSLFLTVSVDMERHGYCYRSEECKHYYHVLKKAHRKRKGQETSSSSLYKTKMEKFEAVVYNSVSFKETPVTCEQVLCGAVNHIRMVENGSLEARREALQTMITELKIHLIHNIQLHPPPPIKIVADILFKLVIGKNLGFDPKNKNGISRLTSLLQPHTDVLIIIAGIGSQPACKSSKVEGGKGEKKKGRMSLDFQGVNWTLENFQSLLEVVKEWRQLCHDQTEVQQILRAEEPVWREVAFTLSGGHVKKSPQTCHSFFHTMCYDFAQLQLYPDTGTTAMNRSRALLSDVSVCHLLGSILFPVESTNAEWDLRDIWNGSNAGGWSQDETLELLFTTRELWPNTDWEMVSLFMKAGGYMRDADSCYTKFKCLFSSYQQAVNYNKQCSNVRERKHPHCYFKIHSLFGYTSTIPERKQGKTNRLVTDSDDLDVCEEEAGELVLVRLKEVKRLASHPAPRLPLLTTLAVLTTASLQPQPPPPLTPHRVWHLMVQLHHEQRGLQQQGIMGPFGTDLDGLWQDHPNPLVAYGFTALSPSDWEKAIDWDAEELDILVKTGVQWLINHRGNEALLPEVVQEALQTHSYKRSPEECRDQWHYMVTYCRLGGYRQYFNQISVIHYIQILHDHSESTNGIIVTNWKKCSDKQQKSTSNKGSFDSKGVSDKRKYPNPNLTTDISDSSVRLGEVNICEESSEVLKNRDDALTTHKNSTKYNPLKVKSSSVKPSQNKTKRNIFWKESSKRNQERNGLYIEHSKKDPEINNKNEKSIYKDPEKNSLNTYIPKRDPGNNILQGPEVEKVRVEVVSMTEEGDRKVLTCVVREGTSTQVITLHFPGSHPVPANTRFIRVPFSTKTKEVEDKSAGLVVNNSVPVSVNLDDGNKSPSAVKESTINQRHSVHQHSLKEVKNTNYFGGQFDKAVPDKVFRGEGKA
ncbi:hypothetical protein Pcinc_029448 [Petrolisthes cinctipes]|uniref:Myb-like domain-containing protein n=1 Tax=Petrolisthes cinctipes TaxID=88211 RepID=A0AAE1F0C1_PETCI|nr:hypothetical protein Pcinc_029448 [Petrolisthes cinctipes]